LNLEVFKDADSVARAAATIIAADARAAVAARGRFTLAVSGGHTPWIMRGAFAGEDVALTGVYQGSRRMTLTFPAIHRARRVLWVVTGSEKVEMLRRLREGDLSIPAGRVRRDGALVLADKAAAGQLAAEHKQGG
jgi:6-phosphogluconolactonase/glucosamine-6-phosphate isomerase/deaminase